jgi:hypothetical protein
VPAWHPNLRIEASLPDTKVVRTAFFINGAAIFVTIGLLLVLGHREWSLHEVTKQIADLQRQIDRDRVESARGVSMYQDFKNEEAKVAEVNDFVHSKAVCSVIVMRLGQITPKRIALDSIDIRSTGVMLRATVKGAPDHASGDASAYEKQLRSDKVLGPMFKDVNLLNMRRNASSGRLAIEVQCEFAKEGGGN